MKMALWMTVAGLAAGTFGAGCYGDRPAAPPQTAAQKVPAAPAVAVEAAPAVAVATAPAVAVEAAPAAAESQAAPQSSLPAPAHPRGPNDIAWTDGVAWKSWDDGLAQARAENRPMALLVYADWCPKCKALAPVFADPEVLALTANLVMIKQDQDDQPAFLQERFGDIGGYVPRLMFLRPDGTLRTEITSGHPRYPYFYNSQQPEALQTSLRTGASI